MLSEYKSGTSMRSNKHCLFLFILTIIILSVQPVQAVPPLPAEYFGNVLIDGMPAPAGTTITAFIQDVPKGFIVTDVDGFFGGPGLFDPRLKVNVSENEFQSGDLVVTFQVNGVPASESILFEPGASQQLNLFTGKQIGLMSVPVSTPMPVLTEGPSPVGQQMDNYTEAHDERHSVSDPSIQYGLDRDEKFTSDDGMAAVSFDKNTLLFSPSGQFLQQVFIMSRSISDLAPADLNLSLNFSGYAYEITPERTYFNPEGVLSIHIPLERISDTMALNPQVFKYLPQTASWEQVRTRSNHFTGEVSGAIHEAAIYALFLEKKSSFAGSNETTMPGIPDLPPVAGEPQVTEYPAYSSEEQVIHEPELLSPPHPAQYYQDENNTQNISGLLTEPGSADPVQAGPVQHDIPEPVDTMQPVQDMAQKDVGEPQAEDIIRKEPGLLTLPGSIAGGMKKALSGPVGIVLGLALLIIIINAAVYLIYTRCWPVRNS